MRTFRCLSREGFRRANSTKVGMLWVTRCQWCTHTHTHIQCITLIEGDGIGPEISAAVMKIFEAAQVSWPMNVVCDV